MIAWFVVWDFLFGIAMVWLYAAIRPRFGAGPKTAAWAGVFAWVLVAFLHTLGEAPMGLWPTRLMWTATIVSLVYIPLAAVAGAWAYKEEAAA